MPHTHDGFVVRQPRRIGGRRFDHLNGIGDKAGAVHALTPDDRVYRALCGVVVERKYGNDDDLDGPITGHVRPAGELSVTCERCRKALES